MESVFSGVDFYHVPGNCDFFTSAPPSLTISLDGVRIFLTHGHLFGVKSGLTRLTLEARRVGAQLALFGHTHRALLEEQDGLWLMNPGACGAGRSDFGEIITDSNRVRQFMARKAGILPDDGAVYSRIAPDDSGKICVQHGILSYYVLADSE